MSLKEPNRTKAKPIGRNCVFVGLVDIQKYINVYQFYPDQAFLDNVKTFSTIVSACSKWEVWEVSAPNKKQRGLLY